MIEELYVWELQLLHLFQQYAADYDRVWVKLTRFGDPAWTLRLYFPLFYTLWPQRSIRFLLAGCISEYANGVLKWVLHGHRPYWYIGEHDIDNIVHLRQSEYTCETGPGSPSGHAMVTAAVFYVLAFGSKGERTATTGTPVVYAAESTTSVWKMMFAAVKTSLYFGLWLVFGVSKHVLWIKFYTTLLLLVALSRLYIAAHFPHQVVLGIVCGIAIGRLCVSVDITDLCDQPSRVLWLIGVLVTVGVGTYVVMVYALNLDPDWTIALARKHCANPDSIHVSTTPIASLVRNIATLFGVWLVLLTRTHLLSPTVTRALLRNEAFIRLDYTPACALASCTALLLFAQLPHTYGVRVDHSTLVFYAATAAYAIVGVYTTVCAMPAVPVMVAGMHILRPTKRSVAC